MADLKVTMEWTGRGLEFTGGRDGGPTVTIDSDGKAGPSPMTSLALGLGGCMAVDVLDITQKMRLPVEALSIEVEGERRAEPPRRFTALRLRYVVTGVPPEDEAKVQRAIDLSREKYCSVLHSLREDIALEIGLELR